MRVCVGLRVFGGSWVQYTIAEALKRSDKAASLQFPRPQRLVGSHVVYDDGSACEVVECGTTGYSCLTLCWSGARWRCITCALISALSVPMSSATAERAFSVLGNREIDNRLVGKASYVVQMMMLACNRLEMTEPFMATLYPSGTAPRHALGALR